jgi:uncharacterized protein YjeT (DUF2065 family)
MWHDLLTALALLLVIEGIFPFLNPKAMRRLLQSMQELEDGALRIAGLMSMLIGLVLLYLVR